MDKPIKIEPGVFMVPVILPDTLLHRKEEFENYLITAQKRVVDFAKRHEWEAEVQECFLDSFEVYDDKSRFDSRVLQIMGMTVEEALASSSMPGSLLPDSYSAALENRVLIAVSPDLFAKNVPGVDEEDHFYEKLLGHEISHRLHVRILKGDEEAMGPIWFFEGFAMYSMDQFMQKSPILSNEEIWEIIQSGQRGSYYKYIKVFTHFLGKTSLSQMVEKAGDKDFVEWLKKLSS